MADCEGKVQINLLESSKAVQAYTAFPHRSSTFAAPVIEVNEQPQAQSVALPHPFLMIDCKQGACQVSQMALCTMERKG